MFTTKRPLTPYDHKIQKILDSTSMTQEELK